jgi:aerobic carbon-monoxide dehydrogenase large subunit
VDKVRYVGEPVAFVVADSPELAEDALELIGLEIDPLPAAVTAENRAEGQPALFDGQPSNHVWGYKARRGDADAAFDAAPYTRRERFYVHRHTGITMETRGVLSRWDAAAGTMTSWGANKVPHQNRKMLAQLLGLELDKVQLIEGDAGGSFGVRGEFFPEDFLAPYCARMLNRPVKWIEDRREHLLAISHARDVHCEIEIACERDGTIRGMRVRAEVNIGAYIRTSTTITPRNVSMFVPGPYRIPNFASDVAMVVSNKSPTGTYRGPGRFESDFFRERLFDMVAGDLGIDRVEFRRRNLVRSDEMPYALPSTAPDPHDSELDSGDYGHMLDLCLEKFGWAEKSALSGRRIGGRYHGIAVGCFIEGGAAGPAENVRMVLEDDGTVSVYTGSSAVGQGVRTILTQIAADALELPMERLRLFHGSTFYVKEGFGSFHSRSTVMAGNAALIAARELRTQILAAAAELLQAPVEQLRYEGGTVQSEAGATLELAALAGRGIAHEATFRNSKHTYTNGAHAVHIAVDPGTGKIEVVDYVGIEDVGRKINPLTLHGQAVGSIVQGLGGALLEHFVYDAEGQMLSGTLADYLVPLVTDFPNIRSQAVELHPSPFHPLGAKGAGEGGTIPVGGLLGNALADAFSEFGVQPHELPLSPARVWRLLQQAQGRR